MKSSEQKTSLTPESVNQKVNKRNINLTGLVVLVLIFSFAVFLTFQAINKNQKSPESDVTAPKGRIITPITGSVINSNSVNITVEASDDQSGVKNVELFYKSKGQWEKLATLTESPYVYKWDVSGLDVKSITLDIHVTDNAGNILNTNSDGWQEDIVIVPSNKGKLN